ncbi:MAG: hypothetical protein ACYTFQ_00330 [Planctomycetota bacterium]|jgi:hypothetical protein
MTSKARLIISQSDARRAEARIAELEAEKSQLIREKGWRRWERRPATREGSGFECGCQGKPVDPPDWWHEHEEKITELERELAESHQRREEAVTDNEFTYGINKELRAEIATLRGDKERLDWLDENANPSIHCPCDEGTFNLRWAHATNYRIRTLREAIDAAIRGDLRR